MTSTAPTTQTEKQPIIYCKDCGKEPVREPGQTCTPCFLKLSPEERAAKTKIQNLAALIDDPVPAKSNKHVSKKACESCGMYEVFPGSRYCTACDNSWKRKKKVADAKAQKIAEEMARPLELDKHKFILAEDEVGALVGQTMDTRTLKEQEFIWEEKLPLGEIILLSGKGDCGKGTCLCDFAARISAGLDWPDGAKNTMKPRKVLLCSTEDDPDKVVLPRLIAHGAKLENVIWFTAMRIEIEDGKKLTKKQFVRLKDNLSKLRTALKNNPDILCVMLDPISDFWGATNPNDNKEMGELLNQLRAILEARNVSLIGIIHHNKKDNLDAVQSIVGAGRTGNAPRAVLGFMLDGACPNDAREYYMTVDKQNGSKDRTGLKYKIVSAYVEGRKRSIGKIEWMGKHDKTTDELKQEAKERAKNPEDSKLGLAEAFLITEMEKGNNRQGILVDEAYEKEGISRATVFGAAKALKLISSDTKPKRWYFSEEARDKDREPKVEARAEEKIADPVEF